ncbi:hypothetical protein C7271_19195 [filamentous cyanobacterium CCP5]|nr:hypothetical protein C7271_19195 [filamentous cyanobacterium CCP5]
MALFHVFVYGTLKPGERAYPIFCQPYVLKAQPALVQGRLYALPEGYPAMTQEPGWVQGYRLGFGDRAVLNALDEFEDYFPNHPEASLYQRLTIPTFSLDQTPLGPAWGYVMPLPKVRDLGGRPLTRGIWTAIG